MTGSRDEADESAPEQLSVSAWRRVYLMARPRATRANAFALLLACLLGFAIATQVRQTQAQGLEDLRQDELVRILDDVTQNGARLDDEIAELEATRDGLADSDATSPEATASSSQMSLIRTNRSLSTPSSTDSSVPAPAIGSRGRAAIRVQMESISAGSGRWWSRSTNRCARRDPEPPVLASRSASRTNSAESSGGTAPKMPRLFTRMSTSGN